MTDILQTFKKSASRVHSSSKPCDIAHGIVISTSPLKVQIDQKLILEKEHLKLTRAVMDYEVEMTVDHVTELSDGHSHGYTGKKKFIVHNGLITGDIVTMIRVQGGQQYIIIDKEVIK